MVDSKSMVSDNHSESCNINNTHFINLASCIVYIQLLFLISSTIFPTSYLSYFKFNHIWFWCNFVHAFMSCDYHSWLEVHLALALFIYVLLHHHKYTIKFISETHPQWTWSTWAAQLLAHLNIHVNIAWGNMNCTRHGLSQNHIYHVQSQASHLTYMWFLLQG